MSNTNEAPSEYGVISENTTLIKGFNNLATTQQFVMIGDGYRISIEDLSQYLLPVGTKISVESSKYVPSFFLELNGQSVSKTDYPKLYDIYGDTYNKEDTAEGFFNLPDRRGYFERMYTDSVPVGTVQTDTMRKIIGKYGEVQKNSNTTFLGALTNSVNNKIIDQIWSATESSLNARYSLEFDSSYGIEGQEGKTSPNVGSETRPMNYSTIWYVKAK